MTAVPSIDAGVFQTRLAAVVSGKVRDSALTISEVSSATGIPPTTLRRRLTGTNPFLLTELRRIAHLLGTTAGDIVAEVEAA